MKKIVFAVEIFGLIAAFPLYLVTELQPVKGASPIPETSTEQIEIRKMPASMVLPGTTVAFKNHHLSIN